MSKAMSWETLRSIGGSPISKLTILTPIIGQYIILNESLLKYISTKPDLSKIPLDLSKIPTNDELINTPNSTSITLYLTYIGLYIFGISTALYVFKCPSEIAKHNSQNSYINEEFEIVTTSTFSSMSNNIDKNIESGEFQKPSYYTIGEDINASASVSPGNEGRRKRLVDIKNSEAEKFYNVMRANYEMKSLSGSTSRGACSIMYCLSIIIIMISSLITFSNVILSIR